jgi:hypothetical protein
MIAEKAAQWIRAARQQAEAPVIVEVHHAI